MLRSSRRRPRPARRPAAGAMPGAPRSAGRSAARGPPGRRGPGSTVAGRGRSGPSAGIVTASAPSSSPRSWTGSARRRAASAARRRRARAACRRPPVGHAPAGRISRPTRSHTTAFVAPVAVPSSWAVRPTRRRSRRSPTSGGRSGSTSYGVARPPRRSGRRRRRAIRSAGQNATPIAAAAMVDAVGSCRTPHRR